MFLTARKLPTKKQKALIGKWSLPVLSDKEQCSLLIGYILQPNQEGKERVNMARLRRLRDYWQKAVVKVTDRASPWFGREGRVTSFRMRSASEVSVLLEKAKITPGPFELLVELEHVTDDHSFSPTQLKVLQVGRQKNLFSPLN